MKYQRPELTGAVIPGPVAGGVSRAAAVKGPVKVVARADAQILNEASIRFDRLRSLGWMATSIIHEIGQPLLAITASAKASLRWLDSEPIDIEEARAAAERVAEAARRLSELVASVRAMAGADQPARLELDPNDLVRKVCLLLRAECLERGIVLTQDLGDHIHLIRGNAVQLSQVLINLMINAMEALEACPPTGRHIEIQTATADDGVMISVRDSGPGIDPGDAAHIFDAYFTSKTAGTGLGLAIARSIVESHGGRLRARQGTIGTGAVFDIQLPAAENLSE